MTRAAVEKSFKDKRFVVIDVDPEAIHRILQPEITLYADVGRAFRALLDLLERRPMSPRSSDRRVQRAAAMSPASRRPSRATARAPRGPDAHLEARPWPSGGVPAGEGATSCSTPATAPAAAMHDLPVPEEALDIDDRARDGGNGLLDPRRHRRAKAQVEARGADDGHLRRRIVPDARPGGAHGRRSRPAHPVRRVQQRDAGCASPRQQLLFESRIEAVRYPEVDFAALAGGLAPGGRLWVGSASTPQELRERLSDYRDNHRDVPGVLDLRLLREEIPPFAPFLGADAPTIPASAFAA